MLGGGGQDLTTIGSGGTADGIEFGASSSFPWIYLSLLGIIPAWVLVRKIKLVLFSK